MNFIHHMSNELACKTQREGQGRLLLIGSEASCIIIGKASLACYRASSWIMRGKKEGGEKKGGVTKKKKDIQARVRGGEERSWQQLIKSMINLRLSINSQSFNCKLTFLENLLTHLNSPPIRFVFLCPDSDLAFLPQGACIIIQESIIKTKISAAWINPNHSLITVIIITLQWNDLNWFKRTKEQNLLNLQNWASFCFEVYNCVLPFQVFVESSRLSWASRKEQCH